MCKCGMPVLYIRNNLNKLEEKVHNTRYGIIIYDEMQNGEFEYKNKKYGVLWEHKGDCIIDENKKCMDCGKCKNNVYAETCCYTIARDEFEEIDAEIKRIVEKIKNKLKKQ